MLARKYRLSKDRDIQLVFKKGQIYFSPFFNLKILANNLENSRFCIIISTNISKKAVVRNKAKRQLRTIIQKNMANISKNCDIIILTKPPVTIASYQELDKAYQTLIKKAKL